MKFFISYLSMANFAYIMRKMPLSKLKGIIFSICNIFEVVSNTSEQILHNLHAGFLDFEDGLQFQAAKEAACDCIVSRNKKDFISPDILVLSPSEFLSQFKN